MLSSPRFVLLVLLVACLGIARGSGIFRKVFPGSGSSYGSNKWLAVEIINDGIVRFQGSADFATPPQGNIYQTPMIDPNANFQGPSSPVSESDDASKNMHSMSTSRLRVDVFTDTLSIQVTDLVNNALLGMFNFDDMTQTVKAVEFSPAFPVRAVYGIAEDLSSPLGNADGDWNGKNELLQSSVPYGNVAFGVYSGSTWKGMAERAEFPMAYITGDGMRTFGFFVDSQYRKEWKLSGSPWRVETWGKSLQFYVIQGNSLHDVRQGYFALTGMPLVPPKKFLGLWQSIFGYRSWQHVNIDVNILTAPQDSFFRFPLDGIALDIYWFGGKFYGDGGDPSTSTMGDLFWDPVNFPDPKGNAQALRSKGIGLLIIEESYLSERTKGFAKMSSGNFLAKSCPMCPYSRVDKNTWWGVGGMIDWSNTQGANLWFDCKHCPLIAGCKIDMSKCRGWVVDDNNPTALQTPVDGFWLDLGEPEMYNDNMYYSGYPGPDGSPLQQHGDYHNLHQLLWTRALNQGFSRNGLQQRPWFLTRSGASGLHRYGVSMWSGDIFPELQNMASSLGMQKHMVMVGMDYFGSDIGGFQRKFEEVNEDEKFTQWFANSCWFDVPVRPHTWQADGSNVESSPARVGHLPSNLFNIRNRYALTPYYYSLAHRARLYGEPVIPPLFYWYQSDAATRSVGNIKLIGRDILVAISATEGQRSRDVYLPAGKWINFHTNAVSVGPTTVRAVSQLVSRPKYCSNPSDNCLFVVPAFVRSGAILPMMHVDENTQSVLGSRWSGRDGYDPENLLVVRTYFADTSSSGQFTLFEDDGTSIAYQNGQIRQTVMKSGSNGVNNLTRFYLSIGGASGSYSGSKSSRALFVDLVVPPGVSITSVSVRDAGVLQNNNGTACMTGSSAWYRNQDTGIYRACVGSYNVAAGITVEFWASS